MEMDASHDPPFVMDAKVFNCAPATTAVVELFEHALLRYDLDSKYNARRT